jgi:uncharacterized membrane protein YeiB
MHLTIIISGLHNRNYFWLLFTHTQHTHNTQHTTHNTHTQHTYTQHTQHTQHNTHTHTHTHKYIYIYIYIYISHTINYSLFFCANPQCLWYRVNHFQYVLWYLNVILTNRWNKGCTTFVLCVSLSKRTFVHAVNSYQSKGKNYGSPKI